MAVKLTPIIEPAESRIAVGHPRQSEAPKITISDMEAFSEEMKERAKYKIEIHFGKDRSSLLHKLSTGALLMWESGKRMHGGGDEKMYWCGYDDCGKPLLAEHFGFMHVVCRVCQKESFLDPITKKQHVVYLRREGKDTRSVGRLPCIAGEKFFKLSPSKIADLLVKTFEDLHRDADIYMKFHPLDMRYVGLHESVEDLKRLELARQRREPVIYPLRRIIQDISTGADLHGRFLAMITA